MKLFYSANATLRELGFRTFLFDSMQLLLAVIAATLVVPITVGNGMSPTAALFGAGVGTLIYVLCTRGRSPIFLGSSHAFVGAMSAAFAGGVSMSLGYLGLIIGALFTALVFIILSIVVKFCGTKWISYVMPTVVIGPIVALIGLELAHHAIENLQQGSDHPSFALLCGLVALVVSIILTVFAKRKSFRMFPFIWGILAAYLLALIFTIIGHLADIEAMRVIDYSPFTDLLTDGKVTLSTFFEIPDFTFLTAFAGDYTPGTHGSIVRYIVSVLFAYLPITFVVFAEHIADHAHVSLIVGRDLLKDPGLSRTLVGDGVASIFGAFFGGCPNSSYSEAVGCMALTGNTSVWGIIGASVGAILLSFFSPFVALVNSIPACIIGGICIAFYGFVAVAGLSMLEGRDLEEHHNLFPISVILITGVGGMSLTIENVTIPPMAFALVLGILTNLLLSLKKHDAAAETKEEDATEAPEQESEQ